MSKHIGQNQKYLSFTLDGDLYALDIYSVREIQEVCEITRVPQMAEHLLGLVNLRGTAVPVVDLRRLFGMKPVDQSLDTRIIIVEAQKGDQHILIGCLADSVREVMEISKDSIELPPDSGARIDNKFITGISCIDSKFIMLLDTGAIVLPTSGQDFSSLQTQNIAAEHDNPQEAYA